MNIFYCLKMIQSIRLGFLLIVLGFSNFSSGQNIHLTTEHYPPYNIDLSFDETYKEKDVDGASVEIVRELMRRSKYTYTLELLPWKRAYQAAENEVYTGVFSTTRTDAREKLFKWVGPIADNNYVLFSLGKKNIAISTIEDVKDYIVGAYGGSVAISMMKDIGVKAEIVPSDHLNVYKLARGRIDLWVSGNLYGPYLAKQYGVTNLKDIYTIKKAQMYIAFNKNTPTKIIDYLNSILQSMRQEGYMEKVYNRYR